MLPCYKKIPISMAFGTEVSLSEPPWARIITDIEISTKLYILVLFTLMIRI